MEHLTIRFGDSKSNGYSIDLIKGPSKRLPDSQTARKDCLGITINLIGKGNLKNQATTDSFDAKSFWLNWQGSQFPSVTREPGPFEFIVILLTKSFLETSLPLENAQLHPILAPLKLHNNPYPQSSSVELLTPIMETWINTILSPPPIKAAQDIWYKAKILELISYLLFDSPNEELFCHKQHRLATIRTTRIKKILKERLVAPPKLKELGRIIGCSPYHLSRTFSEEAGMTIPQYIRQQRMEKAAALLQERRLNVTEVAMEVGYNSISHFSQAFCQTIGTCPTMYAIRPQKAEASSTSRVQRRRED